MNDLDREKALAAAASDLNNLLHIIAGAVATLEEACRDLPEAGKPLAVLRSSVDRAADVTEHLAAEVGGAEEKILLHPAFVPAARKRPSPPLQVAHRILVVDDEPMALELSRRILTQAGFVVATAGSGAEALEVVARDSHRFDLYLVDLNMPTMDGEETFLRLRGLDPKALILLNTGFIERHRLERMMANGLSGFLRRPYRSDEMIGQISSILASGKRSRANGTPPA
jgi:CheY-like chemotaxis protein